MSERDAEHTGALAEVQPTAGDGAEPASVQVDGDEIVVTLTGASGGDVATTWADFALDDEGRLESFTIDGEALDERLIIEGDTDSAAGVTATVVSALELVTNDSPVVLEIEHGARRDYRLRQVAYETGPEERQSVVPDGAALVVLPGAAERTSAVFDRHRSAAP